MTRAIFPNLLKETAQTKEKKIYSYASYDYLQCVFSGNNDLKDTLIWFISKR